MMNDRFRRSMIFLSSRPRELSKLLKMIPNLVTVTGMGCGFFAILVAHRGAVGASLFLILCSVICDVLDGKLARRLGVSSSFGAELDSFSDVIAFGVAPAVILFEASLHRLGWVGAAAAFFFLAMAVVRLIRFNLDASQKERRDFFRGFSTPTAALYLTSFIVMRDHLPAAVGVVYALTLGSLMVSSFPVPAFKGAGLSPAYLAIALLNTLILFLSPSVWTFAWWNLFGLFVLFQGYRRRPAEG